MKWVDWTVSGGVNVRRSVVRKRIDYSRVYVARRVGSEGGIYRG